ncbi:MAG: hypothetical protein J0M15_08535 [Deltaproteobacteria bacterium]|nr:hypothetical protein [Deltaproteobacteria bacterium]
MSSVFRTVAYGKWILSGEHSVLRGQEAIVVPLFSKKLYFEFLPGSQIDGLRIHIEGSHSSDIESIVRALFSKAIEILELKKFNLSGDIRIQNEIPLGSGLGASSSLCVAFGRWFCSMNLIEPNKVYEFSRNLENLFHGESSGVDIAVVLNEKPLIFKRPQSIEYIENYFKPHLYLSYSGQRGVTKDCVEKVKKIFLVDPEKAQRLDQSMVETTQLLKQAFIVSNEFNNSNAVNSDQNREKQMILGINNAYSIFQEWGLTRGAIDEHISSLKRMGALACKPTGSGGGGYVLSLWPRSMVPSEQTEFEFIPI